MSKQPVKSHSADCKERAVKLAVASDQLSLRPPESWECRRIPDIPGSRHITRGVMAPPAASRLSLSRMN
jgi:hypothetical protein